MISRKHRFHGFKSLRHVYSGGQMARGPLFSVKALLNPRRRVYRLAVVVSRKVHKSAVVRNRIRRRLYEAVRQLEDDIVEPYDIVITIFSDSVLEESATKINSQLKSQLKNLNVLKQRVS